VDHNLTVFIGSLMNIFVINRMVRVFFDITHEDKTFTAVVFLYISA